jgi:hypothetical protein
VDCTCKTAKAGSGGGGAFFSDEQLITKQAMAEIDKTFIMLETVLDVKSSS